jgi:putative two-component system response regulator
MADLLVVDRESRKNREDRERNHRRLETLVAERTKALEQMEKRLLAMMEGSIQALAATSQIRDPYTAGHERRVADLASAIATRMGLTPQEVQGVRVMGFLHDLGKIAVPTEILSKPGKLNDFEYGLIKSHPKTGAEILGKIEFTWPIAAATLQHHERLDGSGYPAGLKNERIILEARILAVADVVEAMSSHRPYRPAFGVERALEEVEGRSGRLYDKDAVAACCHVIRDEGFEST